MPVLLPLPELPPALPPAEPLLPVALPPVAGAVLPLATGPMAAWMTPSIPHGQVHGVSRDR